MADPEKLTSRIVAADDAGAIGTWRARRALERLSRSALAGHEDGACQLCLALVSATALRPDIERILEHTGTELRLQSSFADGATTAWAETRNERLHQLIADWDLAPRADHHYVTLHRFAFGGGSVPATRHDVDGCIALLADPDPAIAATATTCLRGIKDGEALQAIASDWMDQPRPVSGEILIDRLYRPAATEDVRRFLAALGSNDPAVAAVAGACLLRVDSNAALQVVAEHWVEHRTGLLSEILSARHYMPKKPPRVALLVALKLDDPSARQTAPDQLPNLVEAETDSDQAIAAAASSALRMLERKDSMAWMCGEALEGNSAVLAASIDAGYLPEEDHERALFLFLTEQWDRYEALDFDSRLLATAYALVGDQAKNRIRGTAARSGRSSVLRVVLGGDRSTRVRALTREEADFLIQQLAEGGDYQEIWKLLFEIPFVWAIAAAGKLHHLGWTPEGASDRTVFQAMARAAQDKLHTATDALAAHVPLAAKQAEIRFNGRINSLAFAPTAPYLAIASNARRVGLWNLQTARLEWVNESFRRSVGKVVVLDDGSVIAAERTNGAGPICVLKRVNGLSAKTIDTQPGSYTGLVALPGGRVATAGRNALVRCLDAATGEVQFSHHLSDWPRAMQKGNGSELIVTHRGVSVIDAETASLRVDVSWVDQRVPVDVAAGPGTQNLIIGFRTAPVTVVTMVNGATKPLGKISRPDHGVGAIVAVPSRDLVLIGRDVGGVTAYSWPAQSVVAHLRAGQRVTSLSVSDSGDFLAIGHPDNTATLWDLRLSAIPALFTQPLVTTAPSSLSILETLPTESLPPNVLALIDTLKVVLRHRFRHDIELDDLVHIRPGRYDITIE